MSELDILIIKVCEIKEQKNTIVRDQQYEKAAALRDIERNTEKKIYYILYDVNGDDSGYDWKKYEFGINKYLKDEYNIDYKSVGSYKQILRTIKLKELGI